MTSLSKSRTPYRNQSATANEESSPLGKQLCLVIGLVCLIGFVLDMLTLTLPLNPFDLPWRVNVLQVAGDRGIIPLMGLALIMYGVSTQKRLKKALSLFCLGLGVACLLTSILVIRDSLIMRSQAIDNINRQETQLQTRIDETQESGELPPEISADQLSVATQQIANRAEALKQNTAQGIARKGVSSISNLCVIGLGLIAVGRVGSRNR
ncbi:MAG: HpsJ family protein [Phormidesmis sp.]